MVQSWFSNSLYHIYFCIYLFIYPTSKHTSKIIQERNSEKKKKEECLEKIEREWISKGERMKMEFVSRKDRKQKEIIKNQQQS
jgi:hypothetical protein